MPELQVISVLERIRDYFISFAAFLTWSVRDNSFLVYSTVFYKSPEDLGCLRLLNCYI